MSLIEVKNIHMTFPKLPEPVLSEISFSLEEGKIMALIGPNGSGKTTLLNTMAGLLSPDQGEVIIDGEKIEGPESRLVPGHEEIKLVYQDYGLKPGMNVYENIRYQLLDFQKDYQEERINEVIRLCQLEAFRTRKPRELSGGQQQRVALANAIATDPKVLLMDEPFSNLDPYTKEEIFEEVRRIAVETGTGITIVTHDPLDALTISDEILFLDQSKIQQLASPSDIYYRPNSLKIANFFGYVSVLSSKMIETLDVEKTDNTFAVRAERVHQNEEGIELNVLHVSWKGYYSIIFLDQDHENPLLMLARDNDIRKGDKIRISIEKTELLKIKN